MMEKYKRQFERVWREPMTAEEKYTLLESFLQDEAAWKATLEGEFHQDVETGAKYLPAERAERVLAQLHARIQAAQLPGITEDSRPVRRLPVYLKWAVAAAVLALIFTGYYLFQQPGSDQQQRAAQVAATGNLRLQTNEGNSNRDIQLEDGSVITLAPGSSVRYYEPFTDNRRDISLSGQAWFSVAKDPQRPFTVYANDIATTALGTQFMVNTLIKNRVEVRLFEGKVVVKSAAAGMAMDDVYLKPGEEFSIDQLLRQFVVKRFDDVKKGDTPAMVINKAPQPEKAMIAPLEFTQEPLTQVLNAIGKRYKVRFIYNEEEIKNEQVTGKFLPADSLETVLSILGSVNRLSFRQHHDSITVSIIK